MLEQRLAALADRFRDELGVDVRDLPGSGAAGGLAGGLAAIGARLVPGAALVADAVGLRNALRTASLAITGEGRFDRTSLAGKVVGHVLREGRTAGTPVAVVAGSGDWSELPDGVRSVDLVAVTGSPTEAHRDAALLVANAAEALATGA